MRWERAVRMTVLPATRAAEGMVRLEVELVLALVAVSVEESVLLPLQQLRWEAEAGVAVGGDGTQAASRGKGGWALPDGWGMLDGAARSGSGAER